MRQGLLIIEASRSHSDTTHSVGLLWTSGQPDTETSTCQHTPLKTDRHLWPSTGLEPAISTSDWPQTHALDRAVTRTGSSIKNTEVKTDLDHH